MKENIVTQSIPGGFAVIASSFIMQSLEHMIPWLIVSFSVIICDLAFGVRKSLLMNEEVRFSGAIRRTMGKMVTYFAFVCMVVMINIASGGKWNIDIYSCLFVCFIEFCSIVSNILKPKGYDFDVLKALGIFCKKVFNVDKEDVSEIITKDKEENK
nr:MAG TPA: holin [Caudoviricetes sp.]